MLLERLDYAAKRFGNARALAIEAGLSHAYLGTLMTRLRRNPQATMDAESAVKIAKAAGVSLVWLLTGEGPRDERVPGILIGLLRKLPPNTYPQVVINQAKLFAEIVGSDMNEEAWRDYLDGLHREIRHAQIRIQAIKLAATVAALKPPEPPLF